MKTNLTLILVAFFTFILNAESKAQRNSYYITNQKPLVAEPFTALPLGAIKPEGMLLKMLEIQRDGLTGDLDSVYEVVCGPNNGWLGGTGDGWERGPYWLDGLVPLAYLLDDDYLKAKAQKWIEWSIANQRDDGYFGPLPLPEGTPKIPGTQQGNREDWWPKMVMLKVLQQYYLATNDERVIKLMTNYFKYQLKMLPQYELGHWTFWGNRRGGDNLAIVYWLYNITREKFLLDLGKLIHKQTYEWTDIYSGNYIRSTSPLPHLHCVNVAQGLKEPIIYYQQEPEEKYLAAVKKGLESLREVHGFVNGMYGGDEGLHGNDPTQGSELCSAIEMMYSFESILPICGDVFYADYLEKIAYNVLPTQHNDEFTRKQYFQQANQVLITDETRNFFEDDNARIAYGVLSGYPCCTCNMHQGWPKFIQNLWYATAENGLAAMVYGPSNVKAKVGDGTEVKFTEKTNYPFSEEIEFVFESEKSVQFPLELRIPEWCKAPSIKVNGETQPIEVENNIIKIDRKWQNGDKVELVLPMEFRTSTWAENALGIERGPLVYALKVKENWKEVKTDQLENTFFEVMPDSPWNYGLTASTFSNKEFKIDTKESVADMPWNLENAPISVKVQAYQIPDWKMYKHSAGKVPVRARVNKNEYPPQEVELIPYGCTTLRISQFPVVKVVE